MRIINNKKQKNNGNKIIYSLTIQDIQNVAKQEIERDLRYNEIKIITDIVGTKINWYDAIANSILEANLK